MDNFTLSAILNSNNSLNKIKHEGIFLGVFPRDKLPKITKFPACFIFNTDPHNKKGEHWLALWVNKNKCAYFFDSSGNNPAIFSLENYLSQFICWEYNKQKIQSESSNCGLYCVLFLLYKSHNKLNEFFKEFNNKNNNYIKLKYLLNKFE